MMPRWNSIARLGAWLAVGLAAVACASAAESGPIGGEGGSAGSGGAESPPGCPPPTFSVESGFPAWARAVPSGICCRYGDQIAAPEGWPVFSSESECESSCRCAELASNGGSGAPPSTERISLECACLEGECVATPEEAASVLCQSGVLVTRSEGCGQVKVAHEGLLVGQVWVFDASSLALVGKTLFSDSRTEPCGTFETRAGVEFSCSEAATCRLCGGEDTSMPRCE